MLVRVQAPTGLTDITLPEGATILNLKERIGLPPGEQELLAGFPPTPIAAEDGDLVSSVIPAGTRVLVRRASGTGAQAGGGGGGGGRRKPVAVRRLLEGAAPRDTASAAEPSQASASAAPAPSSSEASSSSARPRKRKQVRGLSRISARSHIAVGLKIRGEERG